MSVISMKQLLEAGVHFGHQTRRWNPKMAVDDSSTGATTCWQSGHLSVLSAIYTPHFMHLVIILSICLNCHFHSVIYKLLKKASLNHRIGQNR